MEDISEIVDKQQTTNNVLEEEPDLTVVGKAFLRTKTKKMLDTTQE